MRHKLKVVLSLDNSLETIPVLQAQLGELLLQELVSSETVHSVSLITEEILANTISRGYPDPARPSNIDVTVAVEYDGTVYLQFCDEAEPLDPLKEDEASGSSDRAWGPKLITSLSNRAAYVRRYGYNISELLIEDGRKGDSDL